MGQVFDVSATAVRVFTGRIARSQALVAEAIPHIRNQPEDRCQMMLPKPLKTEKTEPKEP
ncbi:hypothetical protein [uncultured Roseobacter sp.]|uniref:hypothetical protein n=1 Tax=uncultured Roseobacter sp. TaxID=114847 RepID=UPI002622B146|nr:hypothetical protein [uncultured Roseobacter sp.]